MILDHIIIHFPRTLPYFPFAIAVDSDSAFVPRGKAILHRSDTQKHENNFIKDKNKYRMPFKNINIYKTVEKYIFKQEKHLMSTMRDLSCLPAPSPPFVQRYIKG